MGAASVHGAWVQNCTQRFFSRQRVKTPISYLDLASQHLDFIERAFDELQLEHRSAPDLEPGEEKRKQFGIGDKEQVVSESRVRPNAECSLQAFLQYPSVGDVVDS